jgi:hypothetical protein
MANNSGNRGRGPKRGEARKVAQPEPDDELATYTQAQLIAMDRAFCSALRKAHAELERTRPQERKARAA